MPRYLADSSIWAWANRSERPDITEKLAERFERGEVVTCAPVILEAMARPRTGRDYDDLFDQIFAPLERLPLDDEIGERALEVQRELAHSTHGKHSRPAADYLIAAIAEAAGEDAVLWGFDKDLRIITEHTSQPYDGERSTGSGH